MNNESAKLIQPAGSGIVCDNPNCGWEDRTVTIEDTPSYLNKPCPKCGENLLTAEDLENFTSILNMAALLNSLTPEQLSEFAKDVPSEHIKQIEEQFGINLSDSKSVLVTFNAHKEITIKSVKAIEE